MQKDNYKQLLQCYNENLDKTWNEWLTWDKTFEKIGKQGLVGILKDSNNNAYIFKISQYINYLIEHEELIMSSLNDLSSHCVHFCRSFGTLLTTVNPRCRKEGNPFDIRNIRGINKKLLLCDYLQDSTKFYNYIRSELKIKECVLYSTIKQILLALCIAQNEKQFTHYDLHSFNVMMKQCDPDTVFVYCIDKDNQFAIPTHGHYPVIIDYGFSYSNGLENQPLWPSLSFSNIGFNSWYFDWVADPKLFLVSVSEEIHQKRNTKRSKKLRKIVKNIFHPLNIDWDCGWDKTTSKSISDQVLEHLSDYNLGSILFSKYDHYCIDIIQTLVELPLSEYSYDDIYTQYIVFIKEFIKIENQIESPFYLMYILKHIVDSARSVKNDYHDANTRSNAVKQFRTLVSEFIHSLIDFCNLEKLHYERLLCSLILLSRSIGGMFYDMSNKLRELKEHQYDKLPIKSIEGIYACIEANIQDNYVYNNNTQIVIMDCVTQSLKTWKLPESSVEQLNTIHPLTRGTFIYDLYNKV